MPTHPEVPSKRSKRRRRCRNCGELFEPKRSWQHFCREACKAEFHRYGSAFGPLKERLTKLVRSIVRPIIDEEIEAGLAVFRSAYDRQLAALTGEVSRLRAVIKANSKGAH